MSVWKTFQEIITLTADQKRLSDTVSKLANAVNEIDKRLIRLETLIEVADRNPGKVVVNEDGYGDRPHLEHKGNGIEPPKE